MVLIFLNCENLILPYIKNILWKEYLILDVMFGEFFKSIFYELIYCIYNLKFSKETLGKKCEIPNICFSFFAFLE